MALRLSQHYKTLLKRDGQQLSLSLEATTVLAFGEIGAIAPVLHRDDLSINGVGTHCARQREDLKCVLHRDKFERHRGEERCRLRLLLLLIKGANLHVRTKAASLRKNLHASLGVRTEDAALLRHQQELERLLEREFIGRDVVGDRSCGDIASLGFVVLDDALLNVGAVAADTSDNGFAVFSHTQWNCVDGASVDVGKTLRHLLLKTRFAALLTEVKLREPRHSLFESGGDLVEVVLHPSGEGIVDEVRKMAFHHVDHGEGSEGRHERRALLPDIAAVLDGANDRRIGRWATNAQFLKTLHEAGLGEPTRR